MQHILFSKMVRELSIEKLIEALKSIGADGVDLCVRDGYPVNPGNARGELPRAAKRIRDAGLVIPMISAPTGLIKPDSTAESLFAACHDAGIAHLKLGYWPYRGKESYWKQIDSARKDIEGFAGFASRFGVRACLHTHSGNNLGLNASSIMHLARGFNPAQIGVYLDPGHLALCGEPPAMAVGIAGESLQLVAIKDSLWIREGGKPRTAKFLPVGEGMVDWNEVLKALKARDYAGPLSFHSEYESLKGQALLDQSKKDIEFIRHLESELN